jgi:hypothetical protein
MSKKLVFVCLLVISLTGLMFAGEGSVPKGVPRLDHVFVIMMENHGYHQILNNTNAPFINQYFQANYAATNYFAIGHPSLTNYLEVVGGSNFGVQSDNDPDWHNAACTTNLASGTPDTDTPPSPSICPIAGTGTDAETPAIDTTNEVSGPPGLLNIDGVLSIPAASNTSGKTIADQLVAAGHTWKSYQESLPLSGPDLVSYSDGAFSNLTDFTKMVPQLKPPLTNDDIVKAYAAKHNPFVYFANVQAGSDPTNSYANVADFNALYGDLASGNLASFSFIAPNQCNDQHGRGNGGPFCNFDPNDNGKKGGLNPALIYLGDVMVQRLVTAIHNSPAWARGHNAIVLLWDENDYSYAPNTNQVILVVDTNYGVHGKKSHVYYNHFSLLKSLESGFRLPCLNHACDANVNVMTDMFAAAN